MDQSRASACKRTPETPQRGLVLGPVGASPGADLGCSSNYSIWCVAHPKKLNRRAKARIILLVAVEDRSGAGFRIKQPLNAGQPAVSQVVMPPTDKAAPQNWRNVGLRVRLEPLPPVGKPWKSAQKWEDYVSPTQQRQKKGTVSRVQRPSEKCVQTDRTRV